MYCINLLAVFGTEEIVRNTAKASEIIFALLRARVPGQ
jgi:hypothetical protein